MRKPPNGGGFADLEAAYGSGMLDPHLITASLDQRKPLAA